MARIIKAPTRVLLRFWNTKFHASVSMKTFVLYLRMPYLSLWDEFKSVDFIEEFHIEHLTGCYTTMVETSLNLLVPTIKLCTCMWSWITGSLAETGWVQEGARRLCLLSWNSWNSWKNSFSIDTSMLEEIRSHSERATFSVEDENLLRISGILSSEPKFWQQQNQTVLGS